MCVNWVLVVIVLNSECNFGVCVLICEWIWVRNLFMYVFIWFRLLFNVNIYCVVDYVLYVGWNVLILIFIWVGWCISVCVLISVLLLIVIWCRIMSYECFVVMW